MMSRDEREIARLQRQIDALVTGFSRVVLHCRDVHHSEKDNHAFDEPCPVVARLHRLLDTRGRADG